MASFSLFNMKPVTLKQLSAISFVSSLWEKPDTIELIRKLFSGERGELEGTWINFFPPIKKDSPIREERDCCDNCFGTSVSEMTLVNWLLDYQPNPERYKNFQIIVYYVL